MKIALALSQQSTRNLRLWIQSKVNYLTCTSHGYSAENDELFSIIEVPLCDNEEYRIEVLNDQTGKTVASFSLLIDANEMQQTPSALATIVKGKIDFVQVSLTLI